MQVKFKIIDLEFWKVWQDKVKVTIFVLWFLFGHSSFPGMVSPIDWASVCLSLEEVAVHAGHEVFTEVDNNSALIVGNPQRILGQQLRTRTIHLLNISMLNSITY